MPRSALALCVLPLALAACGTTSPTDGGAMDAPASDAAPGDSAPQGDGGAREASADGGVVPYSGPDDWCPGRSHCTGMGDNRLYVGAAREDISPTLGETMWTDTNMNHSYDRGEPFVDLNGNGRFDATWMAGYGTGRPATAINPGDGPEVRAIAFRWNDLTIAWAVVDTVGYFINDMDAVRADPQLAGMDIDRVIISATHVHEAVDVIGIWGVDAFTSGLNQEYQNLTHTRTARALRNAVMNLRPARMYVAQTLAADAMGNTLNYVNDTRDPIIFDPTITVLRFAEDATPTNTIATWVNFAAHPEFTGSRNNIITADYPHWLRETVERGGMTAMGQVTGVGGVTMFLNGPLGGQVGPGGGVHPIGPGGMPLPDAGLLKAEWEGRNLGALCLQALQGAQEVSAPGLSYRTAPIFARVENVGYHAYYLTGVFQRQLVNFDTNAPIDQNNMPWVNSRVTYVQLGPVAMISAPGELHPDLWVGYMDRRWSWGRPVVDTTQPNSPDLARAPQPPYLRDVMLSNPGVRYAFVAGLTEDFLGYIVPSFNYVLNPVAPYVSEAAGDHYEETNSIGPAAQEHLYQPMMNLAQWRPPAGM